MSETIQRPQKKRAGPDLSCVECNGERIIRCLNGIDACRACAEKAEADYQRIMR
jgi:ribosomal protein L37AE/L43A